MLKNGTHSLDLLRNSRLTAIFYVVQHSFGNVVLMSYARLSKKPLLFRSFTGLEISEFNEIYAKIESRYNEHEMSCFFHTPNEA